MPTGSTAFEIALAHHRAGRLMEAIAEYRRAAAERPDSAPICNNLAVACRDAGLVEEAVEALRRATSLSPNSPELWSNLGNLLRQTGDLNAAVAAFEKSIALRPNQASLHNNLAVAWLDAGRIAEAIDCWRQAMALDPTAHVAHSNLLYAMHFDERFDAREILREHLLWNERHGEPLRGAWPRHDNDPTPERRLRLGYVSAHFRSHVVGRFILPLLQAHDRERFEVVCYAGGMSPADELTRAAESCAARWRNIGPMPNEQVARLVHDDRIDILVDLDMHMSGSRLSLFARKPAPVQVTYLAYCGTTGLAGMDWRISDPYLDPPGTDDLYSERTMRLPETYWCYQPVTVDEPAPEPMAAKAGGVTFGCLNNFAKVTRPTLLTWARLLREIPESRLLLHTRQGDHRRRALELLAEQGVDPGRVQFHDFVPLPEYFRWYGRIDIALDPFPWCGGTTSCDALWMGVPVVTLRGRTAVGRGGVSILSNIGLPELIADDIEAYIRIATELARDLPRLTRLRRELRPRMARSPLMDAPRFARNMEAAYRTMWRQWCAERS